jgi:dTDP-4-dehydrorhamnose reductase
MENRSFKKIWLIGSLGMLGSQLKRKLEGKGYMVYATDLDVDITDRLSIQNFLNQNDPEIIVNCAAYTAVDRAEEDSVNAYRLNAEAPGLLAREAEQKNIGLIHFSTDYVFNGEMPSKENNRSFTGLAEDKTPGPVSVYGASKYAGELLIQERCSRFFILRTAWLSGHGGNNFVNTMLDLYNTKAELNIVHDQWGCPTFTEDLSDAVLTILDSGKIESGIYHAVSRDYCTWFEFASTIFDQARALHIIPKKEIALNAVSSDQFKRAAKRPFYSVLNCQKLEDIYGVKLPSWQDALRNYLERYKKEMK